MFHKAMNRSISFLLLLVIFILPVSAQQRPTPPTPVPPTDNPVLTSAQMRSAIVVSDMRATNRVMVRPNQEVVYRLADCDGTDKNESCYVVISAETSGESVFSKFFTAKPATQSINRPMGLQCSVSVLTYGGAEMARLVQRVGVTFHTNSDRAPVTLNWGDTNGTWAGALFKWHWISGPTPNPGWGTRAESQAFVNTSAFGEEGTYVVIGWIGVKQVSVGVGLGISSSGWGCF